MDNDYEIGPAGCIILVLLFVSLAFVLLTSTNGYPEEIENSISSPPPLLYYSSSGILVS